MTTTPDRSVVAHPHLVRDAIQDIDEAAVELLSVAEVLEEDAEHLSDDDAAVLNKKLEDVLYGASKIRDRIEQLVMRHPLDCACAGLGVCDFWNSTPSGARAE